jgi:mannose-6-phosphate isomerase
MDRIRPLRNPIRDYAWGSRTALAELQGRPAPTDAPEAELWMGAHPSAPSQVRVDASWVSLLDWIARDPAGVLGREVAVRFHGELPFLMKVLAPERALSIQTHPDAARARVGFERENAAGLAADDPQRCYRDPNPKPELICALTSFDALCGFRPLDEIAEGLAALAAPSLEPALAALRARSDREGLTALFSDVMTRAPGERERMADEVSEAAAAGRGEAKSRALVLELADQHPGDPGVLAPVLLNRVQLRPGQALFLPAGELHAYLRGVGVELMANSDNVLRGGLTEKHVDVPELLETLTFSTGSPPLLSPRETQPGRAVYDTPAREFALAVLRPKKNRPVECDGPRTVEILLCTEGEATLCDAAGGEAAKLLQGQAALVPAAVARYRVEGQATVYAAGVPR